MTLRTTLFGGPLAGSRVAMVDDIVMSRSFRYETHPGGPYCYIMRTGRYRKFHLVPTAALWTWDDKQ